MTSLLHALGQVFLFVILAAGALSALARVGSAAFQPAGRTPTGRSGFKVLRSPAPRPSVRGAKSGVLAAIVQARAEGHKVWQKARAADWLEQQRAARKAVTAGGTTVIKDPAHPRRGTGGTNGNGANGGNGSTPVPPPPTANGTGTPARPGTPGTTSTNGGTVAGTSTASAEQLTEAINQIYAHAASGGLTAKQEAIRSMHEAAVRFAGMTQMLSRTMSEPGSNYGPEITEPLAKAGTQFQAGAMLLSEADNALETLANMTLREVAQSPRQAPHHTELAESGRH